MFYFNNNTAAGEIYRDENPQIKQKLRLFTEVCIRQGELHTHFQTFPFTLPRWRLSLWSTPAIRHAFLFFDVYYLPTSKQGFLLYIETRISMANNSRICHLQKAPRQ